MEKPTVVSSSYITKKYEENEEMGKQVENNGRGYKGKI
jgi:hypothetical protein